jgi:glycerophosphoryl diester phosphodiesterase
MLWISHRGESHDAPENTLKAFRLAWERGTDGIELDIRLTADGQVVCIHDADTGRVGGKKLLVAEESYETLSRLDVGEGERIPLLSQVLVESPKGSIIYIEIKDGPEILIPLAEIIKKSPAAPEDLRIIDFKNENLTICKKLLPDIKSYLLSGIEFDEKTKKLTPSASELLTRIAESGADGFDIFAREQITKEFLEQLRSDNAEIAVWTIDELKPAGKFVSLGVDAITSNRAAYLQKKLEA